MRILLIYPPQVRPFMPHLALPLIKTELTNRGHQCKIVDINMSFYNYILSTDVLKQKQQQLLAEVNALHEKDTLNKEEIILYSRKAASLIRSNYILDNIERALKIFNSPEFYDFGKYKFSLKIIEEALELYSCCYGFTDIGLSKFRMRSGTSSSKEIWEGVNNVKENPIYEMIPQWINNEIDSFKPDAIAITFSMDEQLIPGFTIANYIRNTWTGLLVAGGGMVTRLKDELVSHPIFGKIFDRYFPFANAAKFCDLLDEFEQRPLRAADNFSDLCPDFDDLDLDSYLCPDRLLPFELSIGCSFAKCFYCNHYKTYGQYRYGDARSAAKHLETLTNKYQTPYFYFVDEDLVPKFGSDLAHELIDLNVNINWMIFGRLHNAWNSSIIQKISQAGCKRMIWGLDSVTEKIQASMNKFTDLEYAEKILDWTGESGITNSLNFIVGYPGETENEAATIIPFLKRNRKAVSRVGSAIAIANFVLVKGSAWDKMQVTPVINPNEDFAIYYSFDTPTGLTMRQTPELAQNLQDLGVDLLAIGKYNPTLRELAFLYCCKYNDVNDIPITPEMGTTDSIQTKFLPVNIEYILTEIHAAMNALDVISEQFKSDWWRVFSEKDIEYSPAGNLYGYSIVPRHTELNFEIPIILECIIKS